MIEARIITVGPPQAFRQQVARAIGVDPSAVEWMPNVSAAESYLGDGEGEADALVVSPSVKQADAIGLAEFVAKTAPATAVVLVRDRLQADLMPAAMRAGIRDVVDLSQGSADLREAVERVVAWSTSLHHPDGGPNPSIAIEHRGAIVSFFSSKGGTGKSFLAANVAAAIAGRSAQDVAVVDLDLTMGDVFSYFDRMPKRSSQDIAALGDVNDRQTILENGTPLTERLWGYGSAPEPGTEPIPGDTMGKILRSLRSTFQYVIVDSSAAYADHVLTALELSDSIYMVAGLDVIALRHLATALDTLLALGIPKDRFRVVLNRADSKVGLGADEVERIMKLRVDAMIPSSRLVPLSLNRGRPLVLDEPRSDVAKSVGALADRLIADFPIHQQAGDTATPARRHRRLLSRS
ncbi:MAG: hypothetical protein HY775_12855 [Acidobacteria bacterium]|nr:hypothetical protein [Acidobacteriota bacterium]